jgi:hypothetical protein
VNKDELSLALYKQLVSKEASTCFLNAPPGAGKSYLLNELPAIMKQYIPNLYVLGIYSSSQQSIPQQIAKDFYDMAFLDEQMDEDSVSSLSSLWEFLNENIGVKSPKNFIILIELDNIDFSNLNSFQALASSTRYLEHLWDKDDVHIQVVLAGFWDHHGLGDYYKNIGLSFPYTGSENYFMWGTISLEDTAHLVKEKLVVDKLILPYDKLIYEITGGHVGLIKDLLQELNPKELAVKEILRAAEISSKKGLYGKALINTWKQFHPDVIEMISKMLLVKKMPEKIQAKYLDLLYSAGIADYQTILGKRHITLKSWYVELLIRNHLEELGIENKQLGMILFDEFIPSITIFNTEGYRVINKIENLVRNFVVTKLCNEDAENEHILQYRIIKEDLHTKEDEDAYTRALDWKERSMKSGVEEEINPLIAYITTGDLATVIRDFSSDTDPSWGNIATAIEEIAPIRNAVMHNQILNEKSLKRLYELQTEIFSLLNYC